MRALSLTAFAIALLLVAASIVAQFDDLGVSVAIHGQRFMLKTQPKGMIIERLHPFAANEGVRLHIAPAGQLLPGIATVTRFTVQQPLSLFQFVRVVGTGAPGSPADLFVTYLAMRWMYLDAVAVAVAGMLAWQPWRGKRHSRGFPVNA